LRPSEYFRIGPNPRESSLGPAGMEVGDGYPHAAHIGNQISAVSTILGHARLSGIGLKIPTVKALIGVSGLALRGR